MRIYTYTETCGAKAGRVCNEETLERYGYRHPCECLSADDEPVALPDCPKCQGSGEYVESGDLNVWEGTPEEIARQARQQLEIYADAHTSTGLYLCREARAVLAELGEEQGIVESDDAERERIWVEELGLTGNIPLSESIAGHMRLAHMEIARLERKLTARAAVARAKGE